MKNSYTLGYDLGNRTVASTAINDDFNILKNHGRLMTQINLFNEGQTKAVRRGFRSARRSYNHKKWLRKQLINWFKINSDFDVELLVKYYRHSWTAKADLDHAKPDLKPLLIKNNTYPTVWHAADALINNRNLPKTYAQVQQLIFEVFYNLLGRRGHFLIPNLKVNQFIDKSLDYLDLGEQLNSVLSFDSSKFNDVLLSSAPRGEKYDTLCKLFGSGTSLAKPIAKFVFGYVVSAKELEVLFPSLPEFKKLNFNKTDIDDTLDELNNSMSDGDLALFNLLQQIRLQVLIAELVPTNETFLQTQLKRYERFGDQLHELTQTLNKQEADNKADIKKLVHQYTHNQCSYLEFMKSFKQLVAQDEQLASSLSNDLKLAIDNNCFLIKTRAIENRNIPHQAIQALIRQIIESQKQFWPVLGQQKFVGNRWFPDEKYDLERFFDFRIPYYIGPLADPKKSEFAWLKRKKTGKLSVFNFTQKIDYPKTSREFIKRLVGKDSQLLDQRVMAANTLTYQKFNVFNELSNLRIRNVSSYQKLTGAQKQFLYTHLFKTGQIVHKQDILDALSSHFTDVYNNADIKGFADVESQNPAMVSRITTLPKLIDCGLTEQQIIDHFDDVETIIENLTAFDSDSYLIKEEMLNQYSWLSNSVKQRLVRTSFTGYGNLSHKLLIDLIDNDGHNVLWYLENTSLNFAQIIMHDDLPFKQRINDYRNKLLSSLSQDEKIEMLLSPHYMNPAVKKILRKFTQNLRYHKRVLGEPAMIAIESARANVKQKAHNKQRYQQVQQYYKRLVAKLDDNVLMNFKNSDKQLSDKEYLYFLQNGKDMYSHQSIDFNNLANYDIDHIVPQSVIKDDSLDNRVLISNLNNSRKSNGLILVNDNAHQWWQSLLKQGLISEEKFDNLVSMSSEHSNNVVKFLKRSLVETNQINKLSAQIATILCPNAKVLLINSAVTTTLRQQFDIVKNRDVNDLHHGVDSYLVAFAGQYLYKKYSWAQPILDYNNYQKIGPLKYPLNKFGFKDLFSDKKLVVNEDTGEIVGKVSTLKQKLIRLRTPDLFNHVNYEVGPHLAKGGSSIFIKTSIYSKHTSSSKKIAVKNGRDPKLYGFRTTLQHRYFVIVKDEQNKYDLCWIPITLETKSKSTIDNWVKLQYKKSVKICSKILPIGTKLHLKGTNFYFRAVGKTSVYLCNQLILPNNDLKVINNIEQAEFDNLLQVLKDIIDYERNASIILSKIQPKSMNLLFSDDLFNQEFTIDELRDLINSLLVVFHCNGQQMSKRIRGVKVRQFVLPKFKFSKIEPVF